LKDLLEPERLYQLGEGDFPPLRTLNQTNLPVASNPLIGRDRELREVNELFEQGARAVTITGPGGSGKTRLALQVAAELVDDSRDGVFWVPLAALSDPQLVLATIAQTVGTVEQPASYMSERETLLLLDSFEHLTQAAGSIAELLAAAPGLRLLVTSRSPLQIEAEHEYPLDPLSNQGAVELFLERARQSGTKVEASASVEAICTRLDNLPLAVELAAGRLKLLGADALLKRLEQRLPLLTGGRRDLPERQRTLRATIEWSYELLEEEARTLFARLSVFAGGLSLEAAEAICEADLDALGDLAAISLLKPIGQGRFLMLETIREYAIERLNELGEVEQLRTSHAKWFLELAQDAASRYYTSDQVELFGQLERDHGNFRAALDWFREQRSLDLELELATSLHDFWIARGYVSEGRARLEPALSQAADVPDTLRAKALDAAAWLAAHQLDYDTAEALGRESLALARALDDDRQIVSALANLGSIDTRRGRNLSGRDKFEEALSRARGISDDVWTMHMLGNLADLALYEREFEEAGILAQECLDLAQAAGDTWTVTISLLNLGNAALQQDDAGRAARSFERGLELAREVGAPYCVGAALEGIAALTAASHPHEAARLIGASEEAFRSTGSELPPFEQGVHDRTVEVLAERIGQAVRDRLVATGSEAALDDAVTLALDLTGAMEG
jgi:predicted ATPase/Tfp pilus assembly protein PilF